MGARGRNMSRKLVVLVIAGLLLAGQAQAQTRGNQLSGINEISLLIEDLDDTAKDCRITQDLVRDAFMYPVSSARFVVKEQADPRMYLNITTLTANQRQLCISNLRMEFGLYEYVTPRASGRRIFALIELWGKGYMRSSTLSDHGRTVREAIERGTKQFITDWNLDNKQ